MADSAKGILNIELADGESALIFHFEKSEDGDLWNRENVQKIVEERGLGDVVGDDGIGSFLDAAAASTEAIDYAIKKGIAPIATTPETVNWEKLPIPDQFAEVADSVLSKAPKPEISREIHDKVTKTKEVTVKPKTPFGKPKTETVEYSETVTRNERVYVSVEVLERGFAEEGMKLGTVRPQNPGLPGKSIRGVTIPIKSLADPFFYAGEGVDRRGDELFASALGFVRIGPNWVDIVRFARHEWSIRLSEDRATAYLDFTVGSPEAPVPTGEEVLAAVEELEYPVESLVEKDEINKIITEAVRSSQDLSDVSLSTSRDASFDIVVTEDKLLAHLNLHKGKGRGKKLNLKEVGAAIKGSGLKGLDFEKIKNDITEFFQGPEFDLTGYVLAEGTPATPGPDRAIVTEVTYTSDARTKEMVAHLKKLIQSDAASETDTLESFEVFSPETIQKTAPVQRDSLILTLEPETAGVNGIDVYGAQIVAEAGNLPPYVLHENLEEKKNIVIATSDGILDFADIDGTLHFRVRRHLDAEITVSVSQDKLEAHISLRDGVGSGKRITRDAVDAAISEAGVRFGIQDEIVEKAVSAATAGTEVRDLAFAHAVEPVNQQEHKIEWLISFATDKGVRIRKDGTADYRNRNSITSIETGREICRVLPAEEKAKDGTDVAGNPLPASQGSGDPVEAGTGVVREDAARGGAVYRAESSGELIFEKGRLEIRNVHLIQGDVDLNVGNVKFSGSVEIGGTVKSGFYIVSGGDISVAGAVEAALLSSDGDIMIQLGVKGAGKAVLRSKKRIMTTFIELATVMAGGDVVLKSALVRSRVKCNGSLLFEGDKGRIVGGIVRSRNGFAVQSIGTDRGIKTQVSFGQDYLISDLIEKEEKEISKVKQRIGQVDREIRQAQRDKNDEAFDKLRTEKVNLLKLLEKRGLRLFTLRERFEEHFPSRVVVNEIIFAGTIIESHGRTYEFTKNRKGVYIDFDPHSGIINVKDLKEAS